MFLFCTTWDSISQTTATATSVASGFSINIAKSGKVVVVSVIGTGSPIFSQSEQWGKVIGVVPSGFRPSTEADSSGQYGGQYWDYTSAFFLRVDTNGNIKIDYKGIAPYNMHGQVVYVVS